MGPVKKVLLEVIDKHIGFVEGMEIDLVNEEGYDVSLNGEKIGEFKYSDLEAFILSQPFIQKLKDVKQ